MKNKKYELLENDTMCCTDCNGKNHVLYRIKYLKNFYILVNKAHGKTIMVKKGELGGYVDSYKSLSQNGNCYIDPESIVFESEIKHNAVIINTYVFNSEVTDNCIMVNCKLQYNIIKGNVIVNLNDRGKENLYHKYYEYDCNKIEESKLDGSIAITESNITKSKLVGYMMIDESNIFNCNLSGAPNYTCPSFSFVCIKNSKVLNSRINGYFTCIESKLDRDTLSGEYKIEKSTITGIDSKNKSLLEDNSNNFINVQLIN